MSQKRSSADSLIPWILVSGVVVFFLSKSAFAKPMNTGNTQTATVGDRVYSVTKLGQGHYIVSLISTGGVLETVPTNFVFNQTEQVAANGDPVKLNQLKSDMNSFKVDFRT